MPWKAIEDTYGILILYARVVNIAATTEEISAQSDTIRDLSDGIQGEVNAI